MSHDNRIYVNTTQNNLVVIDGEQNQLTVTHPITQVIEITQSPRPTIIVTEETPNNVSVTEAIGNTVIVSAVGLQGVKGDRGSEPELTALELFTGSIQIQVNNLTSLTASYATTGSNQFKGTQSITGSLIVSGTVFLNELNNYFGSITNYPIQLNSGPNAIGIGMRTNNLLVYPQANNDASITFGYSNSAFMKIIGEGSTKGLRILNSADSANIMYMSSSGFIGIGTRTPSSNLHVYKGLSGATDLALSDGRTMTLENNTTNYINFKTPDNVYAGLAFSTPTDSSAGYISLRQSTGDMVFSNEKATGYHTFQTADTERLRIANTETTVRNNLIVSGASSQFTASGESLLVGKVQATNQFTASSTSLMSGQVNIGTPSSFTSSPLNVFGNTHIFGNVYLSGTTNFIQNAVATRANIHFGSVGNSWLNNGNFGLGTSNPTQRLDVVGSASFAGNVTVSNVLTLAPQHPLPSVNLSTGSFAVSSSTPPKPYFWDGTNWYALY
jgi:hypothetical protein